MRFYPRQAKARRDALMGPGHIGNHEPADLKTQTDRLLRVRPDIDTAAQVNSTLACYGGNS